MLNEVKLVAWNKTFKIIKIILKKYEFLNTLGIYLFRPAHI